MPKISEMPDSTRFFGRVEQLQCECPKCGYLILTSAQPTTDTRRRARRGSVSRPTGYNYLAGRLRCPKCQRHFGVGLLLYPLSQHVAKGVPPDWRPTWQELLEMRSRFGGHYLDQVKRPGDHQNLYVEAECICGPEDRGQVCPIHGRQP